MFMKFTYLYFLLALLNAPLIAQSNLIVNPDFISNVNNWTASGTGILKQVSEGALSPGAAQLSVSESGNIGSAQLRSSSITIPPQDRGKMYYLSLYARSNNNVKSYFRIRVNEVDTLGKETNQTFDDFDLTNSFQDFSIPIYLSSNITSIQINLQCGLESGDYFFDDLSLILTQVEAKDIAQFDHWKARKFNRPAEVEIQSLGTGTAALQLTLNTKKIIAPVLPTQFGVNSNFRSGNDLLDRTELYESFGAFRFPAGSGSNQYFWDCNIPPSFEIPVNGICATNTQNLNPENFVSFKNNADGEATVVVNYMYARYGITTEGTREARVQQAADYAANLVKFLNVEKNAQIKYWEIGNECYGPWETGYDVNGSIVTGKEYGEDFRVFAETMKAVDENIKVGAVMWHKDFEWNNQVLKEVKDHTDFLIVHHYFTIEDAQTAANALLEIEKDVQEVQAAAAYHSGRAPGYFPIVFTEFNVQGDQATTITNGLFVAETLAAVVKNGYSLSTIWVNEWNIDGNHSKGLLAKNDPDQPDYSPRPMYTPFYFFDKYFGDQMIASALDGNQEVRAYASTFSSGETGVLLVNYSNAEQQMNFNFLDTAISADSIYWHTVHAENKNAGNKKFFVNGVTGNSIGGGPDDLKEVPAYAAEYAKNNYLTLPKLSATYLVFNTNVITSTESIPKSSEIIYPNPTNQQFTIKSELEPIGDFQLFNVEGKLMNAKLSRLGGNAYEFVLDASGLPNGIYFLRTKNTVFKLLKN